MKIAMRYIGSGAFRLGIPARDLTAAEVEEYGGAEFLERTGLYEPPPQRKAKKATQEVDDGH